jgi:hypothetical protein
MHQYTPDGAPLHLGYGREQLIAHHSALEHNAASSIDPMQLENVLGNIDG